jgi:hypothetical protein
MRAYLKIFTAVLILGACCHKNSGNNLSKFDMYSFDGDSLLKPDAVLVKEVGAHYNECTVLTHELGMVEEYNRRITSTGEYRGERGHKMQLYFPYKTKSAIVFKRTTGRNYEIQLMNTKFYFIDGNRYQMNAYNVTVGGTGETVYYCSGIGIIGYTSFAHNANFFLNHNDRHSNHFIKQLVAQVKSDADLFYPLHLRRAFENSEVHL